MNSNPNPISKVNTKVETLAVRRRQRRESPTLYFAYGSNLSLFQMRIRCPGSTFLCVGVLRGWNWVVGCRGYSNVVPCGGEGSYSSSGRFRVGRSEVDDDDGDLDVKEDMKSSGVVKEEGSVLGMRGKRFHSYEGQVYGLVYALSRDGQDEMALDMDEGVPWVYEKVWDEVEVFGDHLDFLDLDFLDEEEEEGKKGFKSEPAVKIEGGDEVLVPSSADLQKKRRRKVRTLLYVDPRGAGGIPLKREYVNRMNRGIEEAVEMGLPVEYVERVLRSVVPEEYRSRSQQ